MHLDPEKKFDKRNLERGVRNGIITEKDVKTYLSKLPDLSGKLSSEEELLRHPNNPGSQTTPKKPFRKRRMTRVSKSKRKV